MPDRRRNNREAGRSVASTTTQSTVVHGSEAPDRGGWSGRTVVVGPTHYGPVLRPPLRAVGVHTGKPLSRGTALNPPRNTRSSSSLGVRDVGPLLEEDCVVIVQAQAVCVGRRDLFELYRERVGRRRRPVRENQCSRSNSRRSIGEIYVCMLVLVSNDTYRQSLLVLPCWKRTRIVLKIIESTRTCDFHPNQLFFK